MSKPISILCQKSHLSFCVKILSLFLCRKSHLFFCVKNLSQILVSKIHLWFCVEKLIAFFVSKNISLFLQKSSMVYNIVWNVTVENPSSLKKCQVSTNFPTFNALPYGLTTTNIVCRRSVGRFYKKIEKTNIRHVKYRVFQNFSPILFIIQVHH